MRNPLTRRVAARPRAVKASRRLVKLAERGTGRTTAKRTAWGLTDIIMLLTLKPKATYQATEKTEEMYKAYEVVSRISNSLKYGFDLKNLEGFEGLSHADAVKKVLDDEEMTAQVLEQNAKYRSNKPIVAFLAKQFVETGKEHALVATLPAEVKDAYEKSKAALIKKLTA